jgi:hypothetical protein
MGTDNHNKKYRNAAGKVVSRVSTVLGNLGWKTGMLLKWQAREFREGRDPEEQRDMAAEAGTLAHQMVENHILRQLDLPIDELDIFEYDPEQIERARNAFEQFLKWETEVGPVWISTEAKLVSEDWQIGGTMDGEAMIDGDHVLVDFKTSKGLYPDHIVQVAGFYKRMFEELNPDKSIDYCIVLRIDREAEVFEAYRIPDDVARVAEKVAEHCVEVHFHAKVINKFIRSIGKKNKDNDKDKEATNE